MSAAVKISYTELAILRETAELQNRSISGQAEHWLRLGRAFEKNPNVGYTRVQEALKGLRSVDDLSNEEQEEYLDRFDQLLSAPSEEMNAFFKDRQERGLGVGMDDAGNIVYASNEQPKAS